MSNVEIQGQSNTGARAPVLEDRAIQQNAELGGKIGVIFAATALALTILIMLLTAIRYPGSSGIQTLGQDSVTMSIVLAVLLAPSLNLLAFVVGRVHRRTEAGERALLLSFVSFVLFLMAFSMLNEVVRMPC